MTLSELYAQWSSTAAMGSGAAFAWALGMFACFLLLSAQTASTALRCFEGQSFFARAGCVASSFCWLLASLSSVLAALSAGLAVSWLTSHLSPWASPVLQALEFLTSEIPGGSSFSRWALACAGFSGLALGVDAISKVPDMLAARRRYRSILSQLESQGAPAPVRRSGIRYF